MPLTATVQADSSEAGLRHFEQSSLAAEASLVGLDPLIGSLKHRVRY